MLPKMLLRSASPRTFATAYLDRALKDDTANRIDLEVRNLTPETDEDERTWVSDRLEELQDDPKGVGHALLDRASRTAGVTKLLQLMDEFRAISRRPTRGSHAATLRPA